MLLLASHFHTSDFYLLFTRTGKRMTFISKQTHLDINWTWLEIVTFRLRVGGRKPFILN